MQNYLTVADAAAALGLSVDWIYFHKRKGRIKLTPQLVADPEGKPLTAAQLKKLAKTFPKPGAPRKRRVNPSEVF